MKIERISRLAAAVFLIGLSFVMAACDTTGASGAAGKSVEEPVVITKGMEASDLLSVLGEPFEIRPASPEVEGTEIWVYRKVDENVQMVVSGTVETPGMDIGGVPMTITDAVYTPATTRTVEETLFLIVDGVLVAWKVQRDVLERLD
ncbi:hypothetical protein [Pelagicoccus albus]|uniref:Beta-barrel assembly machine subunit BamE n=1 Tax=Pelagicoccus albus TaxID=415222 RepID=A0A7X1B7D7_9BACT|nr:hypothetical protein [Pelagicoccus albus]MBC2607043.1 hypothetical protein [Pelagicoccus albus]